jgi:sulfate/thiosulfate-binding protein
VTFLKRSSTFWLNVLALIAASSAVSAVVWNNSQRPAAKVLLNVSYDPTRELFHDINAKFIKAYELETGVHVSIQQSHGGSSKQAQAVIGGLDADVVALALPSDLDILQRKGLIAASWANRLPNHSEPYASTIVFVVRKGNPKGIRDWPELIGGGVSVITPDPKSSGNGKLSLLAAWGSVIRRGGTESAARQYLAELYAHVPVLDPGSRGATNTFTQDKLGDVHLTWENEALLETAEYRGEYEIVYPPISIRAEPAVAWVDSAVARHHTEAAAKAYLEFLFSAPAQDAIAQHGYRPADPAALRKYAKRFPAMDLFPVTAIAKDWDDADRKFFADGGIYDAIRPVFISRATK